MGNKGDRSKGVSWTVFIGLATIIVSVGLFFVSAVLFIGIGKVMAIVLFPIGLVFVAVGLLSGWKEAFADPSKQPVERRAGVYVVAKVVADRRANPVIDPEFHDPSELRYLVQIEMPGGGKKEFEASPEVFNTIGEGMNGDIVFQGRWLSQFTFVPRQSEQPIGEDPLRSGRL